MIAGAVFDPNRGELFTATRDGPALLTSATGTRELHGRPADPHGEGTPQAGPAELAGAMVATGLAYDSTVRGAQAMVLTRLVPRARDIRRFGSAALDLAWTAAGRYDAYFERTVKAWDIAAGSLICERAGLRVLELEPAENLPGGSSPRGRGWPSPCTRSSAQRSRRPRDSPTDGTDHDRRGDA